MSNQTDQPQRRTGQVMLYLAFVIVLALLTLLFENVLDHQANPNRSLQAGGSGSSADVVLYGDRSGHYVAPGSINGEPVRFLLDTGASSVSVPAGVAARLGLRRGRAGLASTANGTITVYDTRLDEVALGGIVQHNVRAHINPGIEGDTVLLGMSFMRNLELVQRDGTLTLRQY